MSSSAQVEAEVEDMESEEGEGAEEVEGEGEKEGEEGEKDGSQSAGRKSTLTPGVVYLSRVPPFMRPRKVRHLLSQYGTLGRVYLQPEGEEGELSVHCWTQYH